MITLRMEVRLTIHPPVPQTILLACLDWCNTCFLVVIMDLPYLHSTLDVRLSTLTVALLISLSTCGCSSSHPMDLHG